MNNEIKDILKSYYDFWFGINSLYEKWAKAHDLTSNSLFVLYNIHEYPNECTQKMICEKQQFSKQTVNTILDSFEAKGYILKKVSCKDRRNKNILLTKAGQKYADKLLAELFHFEECALQNMGYNQCIELIKNNHAFLENLQNVLNNQKL